MNRIYGILSVAGWAWCAVAGIYLLFRLRRGGASGRKDE
jgi:hypothetical protein